MIIPIDVAEARAIQGLFSSNAWEVYMDVIARTREMHRDKLEAAERNEKVIQGTCLALASVLQIEERVRDIIRSSKED